MLRNGFHCSVVVLVDRIQHLDYASCRRKQVRGERAGSGQRKDGESVPSTCRT
jgi:hypothetical protein